MSRYHEETLRRGTAERGAAESGDVLDRLAVRAAGGDRTAFEQIYNLLAGDLYLYVRGQCRDEAAAEDLLADVFLRAWRSAKRYRSGSGQFRRWIFTIARNVVRDYWRTSKRHLSLLDLDFPAEAVAAEWEEAGDERQRVARAMGVLTDEQRQVVVLRFFNNMSHEEIAAVMGKREGAVRAQLMRALRRMRKVMLDAAA